MIRLVLAALLALGVLPARVAAIEEEDIAGQLAEFRGLLQAGQASLDDLEFADAIEKYTTLIDAYKTGRIPMVTPDAGEVVAKSFEGRALALANLGRNAEASEDFEALVRFDPTYAVDVSGISRKIVQLYMDVRKRTVGSVTIETDPMGAEVTLSDRSLGPAPVTDREVVLGTYTLRISRAGFDPVEEEIVVEAGGKVERQFRLIPNARSMRIATVPREVRILVDGEERGSTFGIAGAEYQEVAREMDLSLTDISEPLLVENLAPGEHEVLLRKECFQDVVVPVNIVVDPNDNSPVAYKPFRLEPSRGSLDIASRPPGAAILLDGEPVGESPATIPDICSGKHDILLEKQGLGRYAGAVVIRRGETTEVDEQLKLSMAAIDLRDGIGTGESLGAALDDLKRYNVVDERSGARPEHRERVQLNLASTDGTGLSEETLAGLREALKVELVAVAVGIGPLGEGAEILLFGPLHTAPDRWRVEAAGLTGFAGFRDALEQDLVVEQAWSGARLIDVHSEENPVILSLTPAGPAETAGLKEGERVLSVSARPVGSVAGFLAILETLSPGEEAIYTVEGEAGTREVSVRHLSTPLLLPLRDSELLYNKAIADLMQSAATLPGDRQESYSWLNIGLALMHFGQWDLAVKEAFRRVDLPEIAGVSRGTERYLTGACYENLGLKKEARAAYEEAAQAEGATLGSHDGPRLSESASLRAARLAASE